MLVTETARRYFPELSIERNEVLTWLLVLPAVVLIVGFYLVPMLGVGAISFLRPEPGVSNYVELAASASVRRVFQTTLVICGVSALISVLVGYAFSLALTMLSGYWSKWLVLSVILPMWISALIRAFAWLLLLGNNGLVNGTLLDLGVPGAPFEFVRNELGVIIGMVHYLIPYAVLALYASMQGIDRRQIWAARSLGASSVYAIWKIFVPQTVHGLTGSFILVFIFGLGFFVTPALLGGGKILMVSEYISVLTMQVIRWGLAAALSMTVLAFSILLVLALSRLVSQDRMFGVSK